MCVCVCVICMHVCSHMLMLVCLSVSVSLRGLELWPLWDNQHNSFDKYTWLFLISITHCPPGCSMPLYLNIMQTHRCAVAHTHTHEHFWGRIGTKQDASTDTRRCACNLRDTHTHTHIDTSNNAARGESHTVHRSPSAARTLKRSQKKEIEDWIDCFFALNAKLCWTKSSLMYKLARTSSFLFSSFLIIVSISLLLSCLRCRPVSLSLSRPPFSPSVILHFVWLTGDFDHLHTYAPAHADWI